MTRAFAFIAILASVLMLTSCSHFKKDDPDDPIEEPEVLPVKVESENVEEESDPKDPEDAIKEFIASQAAAMEEEKVKEAEEDKPTPPYTLNIGDVLEISILEMLHIQLT